MVFIKLNLTDKISRTGKLILAKALAFAFSFILIGLVTDAFAQSETTIIKQGDEPRRLTSPIEVRKLAEWKRFNLSEGNLSILFPDKPGQYAESSKPLPSGFVKQYRYYWDTSDEQLYFEAQILEISPDKTFNLELGVQGFKQQQKSRNATFLNEKKTQVNGIPTIDLSYRIPDEPEPVLGYSRSMFCGNQIYTLLVAGTKKQKDLSDVVSKYFDSFSPTIECKTRADSAIEINRNEVEQKTSTPLRRYIRGRKGGCYYISSKRNKVYVDKSLCR